MKKGRVWLIGAGPGDPGLITVRGLEVLRAAEVVLYDALAHPALLEECGDAVRINVGKRYGQENPSQDAINQEMIAFAREGKRVVRLKGGDPLLFARGAEEALALAAQGIPFEIVPGISSPVATSAYAGIPLTHRELSSSVTFITGSDRTGIEWSPESWKRLATATDTLCILMGMRRIEAITQALIDGGRAASTPSAVIHWGARPEQRVVVGRLDDIARLVREAKVANPSVIVVGEVVRLREVVRWYDNRPLFGKRILVPRAKEQAQDTVRAIRERGAEPVVIPLIEISDIPDKALLDRAIRQLDQYEWVLFTSMNAVERFFGRLFELGLDARALGGCKIGVVGEKTGALLKKYGVGFEAIAPTGVGEELAARLLAQKSVGRVLLPRALVANEALPEALRAHGAVVDVVAVYETRRAPQAALDVLAQKLAASEFDAVLLTSGSVVQALVEALGGKAHLLGRVTLACIGPVTAREAEQHGLSVSVLAAERTVSGLLDALEAHFA